MVKKYVILLFLLFSFFALCAQWTALNGPPGGSGTDFEIDAANGKLYSIINSEHLFVSSNDGASWTEISTAANLYPYDLLINGNILLLLNYSNLYKSEDAGATWVRVSANNQFSGARKLYRLGSSSTFFIAGWDGLYVSEDAGVNWKKIYEGNYVTDLTITASGDVYFSSSEGISKHAMPATGQQWAPENVSLVLSVSNNTIRLTNDATGVYAITDYDVIKSSNNGASWPSIKTSTITESYFYTSAWGKASNGLYVFNPSYNTAYFTGNNGTSWSAKTGLGTSSYINEIRFADNNKAFVGVDNDGIFKTTDAASTWTQASTGINLAFGRSIVVSTSGRILISTGYNSKGYWFSDNAGAAWSRKSLANAVEKLKRLPNNTILGLGYSQLQYSTDNGSNWTAKTDGTTFQDVTFNTTFSSTTVYGVGYSRISKSTDGINWTDLSITGLPAGGYQGSMIAQDDSGNLFVYIYSYDTGQYEIYVITGITAAGTTGAASLLTIPLGGNDEQYGLNVINMFVSNNKFYVGSYDQIYITANQGSTWTSVNFSKNSLFPIRKGSDYAISAGTTGSLYTSQDDGKTWVSTNQPTSGYTYITAIAEDAAGDYYATGYQTPALKYTNDLILPAGSLPPYIDFNWQPTNGPYGGSVSKLLVDNSNNTYGITSGRLFKTTPTFSAWVDKSGEYFYDLELIKSNGTLLGLGYQELYSSTNGGDNWTAINTESIPQRRMLRRCPNGDLVMMAGGNAVYVSTDGGATFGTAKYTTSTHLIRDVLVTSNSAIIIYLRPNTSPFLHTAVISTDRGATWNPMNLNASSATFSRLSADANGNIYSSVNPVSKSSDNGANWTSIVGNLPSSVFSKVFVSPSNALYAAVIGTPFSLYKSTNGGTSWTKTGDFPLQFSVNDITWIGSLMVIATSQGVYTSTDDGATFTFKTTGITFGQLNALALGGPAKLVASGANMGFYTTDGSEWILNDIHGIQRFFRKPDGTLLGNNFSNLYSTPDQGVTWNSISEFPPNGFSKVVTGDNTTYYGTDTEKIYVSTNLNTWTEFAITGLPTNPQLYDITADANGFLYVIVYNPSANKNECYQIVFGAASILSRFENPSQLMFRDGKVFLYESNGTIASCSDGSNWTIQAAPAGDRLIITTNNYYFVPQYGGSLWLSRDRGASWQNVGLGTSNNTYRFTDIVVNEYNGYAYAAISNSVVRKSANIVIPPETTNPVLTSLQPANNATNVVATSTLKITFDEACLPVSGKKIRIFDADNTVTAVEIIDATAGTQDGKTFIFTPANPLAYENTYFVIVDNGAFTDIFGNPFGGITSQTAWKFTIQVEPDNIKPVITPSSVALVKGGTNKLQITVTDAGGSGLNASSVKIFYRGIMSTDAPAEASMTNASGNTFEVTVPDAWMDELGLEYAYEARDNQGNVQVSPDGGVAAGNYHKTNFSFSETSTPSLPASVLSFGGKLENYRVFSIPHKLSNANISAVFAEVTGLQPKKDFRILHFSTETNKYNEYPTLSSITRGMGYWINFKQSIDPKVEGASTPENSKENLFTYTLKPGWNQIGNPYPFTISWNAVKTAAGNANIGGLKTFKGSTFEDGDKMNPFEGGFVLLNGTSDVPVEFPFSAKTTSGRTGEHHPDFEGGWMIPLTIENSSFHTSGGVGMHPKADLSFDQYDDAIPPAVFELPEISFQHNEHLIKHFTRDVVPPHSQYTWTFSVRPAGEPSTLRWDINAVKSLDNDLYLLNEREQKLFNMTEEDHCDIAPGSDTDFKLFYGYRFEDIKPTRIQLGKPYPNPFTTEANIAFTLPENNSGAYAIALDVFDLMGKKVATLARGEYPSGFYVKEWRPEPGSANASLYLFRLTVSTPASDIIVTEKIMSGK